MLGSRRDMRQPIQPGWYPDGDERLRYFDGATWTDSLRQRPSFTHFVGELPPTEVSFRRPAPKSRRLVRLVSIIVVALLLGGVIAQLIILSVVGNASPKIRSLASYRQAATSVCSSVFDGVSVGELEKDAPSLLGTKLDQSASAFGVLAGRAPKIAQAKTIAARWSDLAIVWGRHARRSNASVTSTVAAMHSVDAAVTQAGIPDCAVFASSRK
jgi:hypothetical protein